MDPGFDGLIWFDELTQIFFFLISFFRLVRFVIVKFLFI